MVRRVPAASYAGPIRTCVGCRQRSSVSDLLRVVAVEEGSGFRIVPDPSRRMPGRGASLHPDQACLDLAQRRRSFTRSLRAAGPFDLTALVEYVAELSR